MDSNDNRRNDGRDSWDTYWRGSGEAGAWGVGGVGHPAFRAFWLDFLAGAGEGRGQVRLLDIGSGDGAVVGHALEALGGERVETCCVDASSAAIEAIGERFPLVRGIVADARTIPLEANGFDIVTSQFGVDYAGEGAVGEAARMLAPGGRMALVLHHAAGGLQRECLEALDAVERLEASEFIVRAAGMFEAGFAAVKGADRAAYDEAASRLAPAVRAVEEIIAEHGEAVAGGTLAGLYAGVARIHGKLPNYEPQEVLAWLERMQRELEPFAGRLRSMMASALDQPAFEQLCDEVRQAGCGLLQAGPFEAPGAELPLAWVLLAERPGGAQS